MAQAQVTVVFAGVLLLVVGFRNMIYARTSKRLVRL